MIDEVKLCLLPTLVPLWYCNRIAEPTLSSVGRKVLSESSGSLDVKDEDTNDEVLQL